MPYGSQKEEQSCTKIFIAVALAMTQKIFYTISPLFLALRDVRVLRNALYYSRKSKTEY